jgi:hypothetical protein
MGSGVAMTKAGVEVDLNRSGPKQRIQTGLGLVGQIWARLGLEQQGQLASHGPGIARRAGPSAAGPKKGSWLAGTGSKRRAWRCRGRGRSLVALRCRSA